jgi:hypothetical protein
MVVGACFVTGGCSASLPEGGLPQASTLIDNAHATTIVGRPGEIYQRIARQAHQCWFGPLGKLRMQYMMHADVPPPSSSDPVTVTVHRRLRSAQKPWGPGLLRLEMSGTTTTTLTFTNIGLDPAAQKPMTTGLTRWANGRTDCDEAETSVLTGLAATDGLATGTTRQSDDGRR